MSNETKQTPASFSKEIQDNFNVAPHLAPAKTDFGSQYRGTTIDLRTAPAHVIKQFMTDYPNQPFFSDKKTAAKTGA